MKKFEKINLGLKEVYEELFMNEMYAKDISKKIRSAQRIKGNSGKPLSQPPYGYMKHPDDCNKDCGRRGGSGGKANLPIDS